MTVAGVSALARAVPRLEKCSFGPYVMPGLPSLAGLRHAQQLRELHIRSSGVLTAREVSALGLAEVRSLRVLRLTYSWSCAKRQLAAVRKLLRSPAFAHLISIEQSRCD